MFSKKATKIDEIFTIDLTLCSKCQIDGEDFVNFCALLRKHKLCQPQDARFFPETKNRVTRGLTEHATFHKVFCQQSLYIVLR